MMQLILSFLEKVLSYIIFFKIDNKKLIHQGLANPWCISFLIHHIYFP